ncbi:hypothetical protein FPV67DRAFT_1674859 [Lyophyllum atratum]|nr:hypothetical protein FPV67DRAFT_1674859 [Lyophyllum atratum]
MSITLSRPQKKVPAIVLQAPQRAQINLLPKPEARGLWTDGSRLPSPLKRRRVVVNGGGQRNKVQRKESVASISEAFKGACFVGDDEMAEITEEPPYLGEANKAANLKVVPGLTDEVPVQSTDDSQDDTAYADLFWAGGISVVQIYGDVFVVQGWDEKSASGTRSWFHLERTKIGTEVVVGCYCKSSRRDGNCVHRRFMEDYGEDAFPTNEYALADSTISTVLFARQPMGGGEKFTNYFSDNCVHVVSSRDMLLKVLGLDIGNDEHDVVGVDLNAQDAVSRRRVHRSSAISYQPVLPPVWAALDTDIIHYARPKPCREAPRLLQLDSVSTCACGPKRTFYDPHRQTVERDCIIYGLTEGMCSRIQLQSCSTCSGRTRRFIGPEPRALGIFNFNNRILFTHELLDDYTSVYTSSETPFTAWVTVVSRRYGAGGSPVPFATEQIFRAAWFAYVDLQDFRDDMWCPTCGPMPEDVIWDGVTVGFNKKHILPTLRPPTISNESSPVRKNQYIWKQQVLMDAKLRRRLRKVVKGAGDAFVGLQNNDDSEEEEGVKRSEAAIKAEVERVTSIPEVLLELTAINHFLAMLFGQHFGLSAVKCGTVPPKAYRKLFIQLAADESVLQMLNKTALDQLALFNTNPCQATASQMIHCPVLLQVLKHHKEPYPEPVLGLCQWLLERGLTVYTRIVAQSPAGSLDTARIEDADWRELAADLT